MTLYVVEYEKIIISFSLFLTKKIPQMIESWQFYIFAFLIGNLKCISLWKNKFQMLRCQWFNGKWSKVRGVQERVLRGSNERIIGEHNFFSLFHLIYHAYPYFLSPHISNIFHKFRNVYKFRHNKDIDNI